MARNPCIASRSSGSASDNLPWARKSVINYASRRLGFPSFVNSEPIVSCETLECGQFLRLAKLTVIIPVRAIRNGERYEEALTWQVWLKLLAVVSSCTTNFVMASIMKIVNARDKCAAYFCCCPGTRGSRY